MSTGWASAAARGRRPPALPALPVTLTLVAAGTVGYGLWSRLADDHYLGTQLSPFVMTWDPVVRWYLLVAVLVWALAVTLLPRAAAGLRSAPAFAAVSYGAVIALGLSLNAARVGALGWWQVFIKGAGGSHEGGFEYLPGLPTLAHGVHAYLAHYPQLLTQLPTHAKGNPPGTLLAIDLLGLTTPQRLAAACIFVGALVVPLTYGLGRTLGGEDRGRRAAILACCSPALQLFGVTSVDYVFAALATATVWLLVGADRLGARSARTRFAAGCALAAIGSLASWLLLAMPACAALIELQRNGRRRALIVALGSASAIVALNLGLWLWQGYDPVAVLQALAPLYAHGAAADRPYAFWVLGSPAAWALFLGLPVAWRATLAAAEREPVACALAVVIVLAAVLGFTKAETERIWLPFVPLACVAATARPWRRPSLVLFLMALQALSVEVIFNTIW